MGDGNGSGGGKAAGVAGGRARALDEREARRRSMIALDRREARGLEGTVRGGSLIVAGVDEAGRGSLAGPVVAGAVAIPYGEEPRLFVYADSKRTAPAAREELLRALESLHGSGIAVAIGIGIVGPDVIDRVNIRQAAFRAMRDAVSGLRLAPDLVMVDGFEVPGLPCRQTALVSGDARSFRIALGSMVAKVTRDRIMVEMDRIYPGYGFARHKGYATREHYLALDRLGPSPIHRRTFAGVEPDRPLPGLWVPPKG